MPPLKLETEGRRYRTLVQERGPGGMRVYLAMQDDGKIRVERADLAMGGPASGSTVVALVPPRGRFGGYRYRRLRRMLNRDGAGPHNLKS